jgi:HEAT repeat protein
MSRHKMGVLAGAAIALGAGLFGIWSHRSREGSERSVSAARAPGGFITGAPEPPAPPAVPPPEEQVAEVMRTWRAAILARDADAVWSCNTTFLTDAELFAPALVESARADGDARVRAFSTRVLGKLAAPALVDVLRERLEDASPFVRENAAWSLGQLRARAGSAAGVLEEVRRRDESEAVRRVAGEALAAIRGETMAQGRAN